MDPNIVKLVDRLQRTEYDDLDACKAAKIIIDQQRLIDRFRTIVAHSTAERTGVYFICGDSEEKDQNGLPKTILVCPSFGLDGFAVYTQTKPYSEPEW